MKNIFYEANVMWSQIDANQHVRHSAYADFAAQTRMKEIHSELAELNTEANDLMKQIQASTSLSLKSVEL